MKRLAALASMLAWSVARPSPAQPFYVPDTISEGAKAELRKLESPADRPPYPAADDLPAWKQLFDEREASYAPANEEVKRFFEPTIEPAVLGGVPVLDVRPKGWKDNGRVAVYLHGGGYTFFSPASTLTVTVPVAQETGLRVISVDYTRAPFAKFRQTTSEVIAVLKALESEGYALGRIAIYGDSAGGGLAAGAVLRMRTRARGCSPSPEWTDLSDDAGQEIEGVDFSGDAGKPRSAHGRGLGCVEDVRRA